MQLTYLADILWGQRARLAYLLGASVLLLFAALGAHDIWTQEHRWADIVSGMFYRHDFLHPYLGENRYYDKPLLSYWMIAAVAQISGGLTTWALRIPSALSGVLAIWSIYSLGTQIKDEQLGLLAGWLLLTTFYFLFWARTSSADMLNMAGSLFAVAWYFKHREQANFKNCAIFFLIVALTSLCKGLSGIVVPAIAVLTDSMLRGSLRQYLRLPIFLSLLPAMVVYLLPFIASSYFGGADYGQSGLYLVYRENILRYFQPFDHMGPIYTYFIYLPIYLLPWAIFFIPAVVAVRSRWQEMTRDAKWCALTLLFIFAFFTASGSRRSYYVLPMVPFAILFTAEWLASDAAKRLWTAGVMAVALPLFVFIFNIFPAWYYADAGVSRFASELMQNAATSQPWATWQVVSLDGESKLNFYLHLPPEAKHYGIKGKRNEQTTASLLQAWPMLKAKPMNTIFVTRKLYVSQLQTYFAGYRLVEAPKPSFTLFARSALDTPVAFIPLR